MEENHMYFLFYYKYVKFLKKSKYDVKKLKNDCEKTNNIIHIFS